MGTRHLTAVVLDGKYKVAQYGQWDGYPSGQGTTILNFLRSVDLSAFAEKVRKCYFGSELDIEAAWRSCGKPPDQDWVRIDVAEKLKSQFPELSRDTGGAILSLIMKSDHGLMLTDNRKFAGDSVFCEWAYVVDLDQGTFEIYKGFNKAVLDPNERFADLAEEGAEYQPVKLRKKYKLKRLPKTLKSIRG